MSNVKGLANAAWLLTALAVAWGCGAPAAPSAGFLVSRSLEGLRTTTGVHIVAAYSKDGQAVPAYEVDADSRHDASARDTAGDQLIEAGDTWYARHPLDVQRNLAGPDADLIDSLAQPAWLLQSSGDLFDAAYDPQALARLISGGTSPSRSWTEQTGKRAQGRAAIELMNGVWDLFVAATGAPRLLAAKTAPQILVAGDISGVTLQFTGYGEHVAVAAPSPAYDPHNPASFPAYFEEVPNSFRFIACADDTGCTMGDTLRNDGGAGTATATFSVEKSDGSQLGSCSTTVPSTPNDGNVSVHCRVVSAAFTNYVDSTTQGIQGGVQIKSPAYSEAP